MGKGVQTILELLGSKGEEKRVVPKTLWDRERDVRSLDGKDLSLIKGTKGQLQSLANHEFMQVTFVKWDHNQDNSSGIKQDKSNSFVSCQVLYMLL